MKEALEEGMKCRVCRKEDRKDQEVGVTVVCGKEGKKGGRNE